MGGHTSVITSADCDDKWIYTFSMDGRLNLWNRQALSRDKEIKDLVKGGIEAALSIKDKLFISGGDLMVQIVPKIYWFYCKSYLSYNRIFGIWNIILWTFQNYLSFLLLRINSYILKERSKYVNERKLTKEYTRKWPFTVFRWEKFKVEKWFKWIF